MATPSPTYVEIVRSRSSIASTYAGWTAPTRTSASPHARTAASLLSARASRSIAETSSSSARVCSAIDRAAVLHGVDHAVHRGVAEEDLERHDRRAGRDAPGAVGQSFVHDDDVGVVGDRVHRRVLDRDVLLLQLAAQGAGQHDAAAHPRVTGD